MHSRRLLFLLPVVASIAIASTAIIFRFFFSSNTQTAQSVAVRDVINKVMAIEDVEAIDADDQLQQLFVQDSLYSREYGYGIPRAFALDPVSFVSTPDPDVCSSSSLAIIAIRNSDENQRKWLREQWTTRKDLAEMSFMFYDSEYSKSAYGPEDEHKILSVKCPCGSGQPELGLLQWVANNCKNATNLVIWDMNDAPVNFSQLRPLLSDRKSPADAVLSMGMCTAERAVPRKSVSKIQWPFTTFPVHPAGPFAVFTKKAVEAMAEARGVMPSAKNISPDIWLGLLSLAGHVKCEKLPGVMLGQENQEKSCSLVLHPYPSDWADLYKYWDTCDQ